MAPEPASNALVTTWSATSAPMKPSRAVLGTAYSAEDTEPLGDFTSFDIRALLHIVQKRKWLVASIIIAFVAIGLLISLIMTPIYVATATIETAADTIQVTRDQTLQPAALQDPNATATYVELLNSRALAERVVNELNLTEDTTFVGDDNSGSLLKRALSSLFGTQSTPGPDNSLDDRKRRAIARILNNTTAKTIKSSRLLMVSFSDSVPERAQKIANAIAVGFINSDLDRRFEATGYARRFLETQLQQMKLKLEESERRVVSYADAQQLVNLDNQQSLLSGQLESLNTALANATIARSNAQELWLRVKDVSDYSEIPTSAFVAESGGSSAASSVINQLRNTRSELVASYQEKALTFKPGFPVMIALKARIDDIDKQIAEEVEKAKNNVRSSYELAVQREKALQSSIDQTKTALLDARSRGVEYTMLQREADTSRSLYDGLLQRYKEISVVGGLASNGLSVVDRADLPTVPSSPKKLLNVLIAAVAGTLLGVAAAFGMELYDRTIKAPDQFEKAIGLPVLGVIPALPKDTAASVALADPHSAVSEAYRSTRTALQFSTATGVPKSLVVTSAKPGEGKTTSAAMLARMFGQVGAKVLLIDGDLRNPSLHKVFGLENAVGLSNYLVGSEEADGLIRAVGADGLSILTSGPIPPNPAELLSGSRMLELVTLLKMRFDLVIIDSAPIMGLADALLLSSIVEGTLLVCAAGETSIETVQSAMKRLSRIDGLPIGAVLTKFDAKRAGHSYGYYGYDYYGYGESASRTAIEGPT